jgi:1-deoxy-D-xylulose-5-phosphate reductoisomerase
LLSVSSLTFEAPDDARFPGLKLAYEVLAGPEGSSVVLNAANEVAVQAFLDERVRFTDIHRINQSTLEALSGRFERPRSLDDLLELNARARSHATTAAGRALAP